MQAPAPHGGDRGFLGQRDPSEARCLAHGRPTAPTTDSEKPVERALPVGDAGTHMAPLPFQHRLCGHQLTASAGLAAVASPLWGHLTMSLGATIDIGPAPTTCARLTGHRSTSGGCTWVGHGRGPWSPPRTHLDVVCRDTACARSWVPGSEGVQSVRADRPVKSHATPPDGHAGTPPHGHAGTRAHGHTGAMQLGGPHAGSGFMASHRSLTGPASRSLLPQAVADHVRLDGASAPFHWSTGRAGLAGPACPARRHGTGPRR